MYTQMEKGLLMNENASVQSVIPIPRINELAPLFEAASTHGTIRLQDYRGKWLVLFSHPADFTPVCTTEFVAFARLYPEFLASNCDLLGLSVDSPYSHVAWLRSIEEHFGVQVLFPVIADLKLEVATAYGMMHPKDLDTATVRSTFIIDPEGRIRTIIYYPMTTGRSVREILRVVQALQTADDNQAATPESWQPGDKLVAYPPFSPEEAEARASQYGNDYKDWYLCMKSASDRRIG